MDFNWFHKKRQAIRKPDLLWVSQVAKYRGIGETIKKKQGQGAIVAIAHFPESLQQIAGILQVLGISFQTFSTPYDRLALKSKFLRPRLGEVSLVLVEILPESFVKDTSELDKSIMVRMIAIEHYPIASKDKRIEDFADLIPFSTEIEFHAALDEPLLKIFGGEKILDLLSSFQVAEDTPIDSNMLTRALENARVKLSKHIKTDISANSLSEWYRLNLSYK